MLKVISDKDRDCIVLMYGERNPFRHMLLLGEKLVIVLSLFYVIDVTNNARFYFVIAFSLRYITKETCIYIMALNCIWCREGNKAPVFIFGNSKVLLQILFLFSTIFPLLVQ